MNSQYSENLKKIKNNKSVGGNIKLEKLNCGKCSIFFFLQTWCLIPHSFTTSCVHFVSYFQTIPGNEIWKTQITSNLIIVPLQTVKSLPDFTNRYICLLCLYSVATKETCMSGVDFMIAKSLKLFGNHMYHLRQYSKT